MEKEKNNKKVIVLLIIIIVILLVLCILFATETISFKSNQPNNENNKPSENIADNIDDNNQNTTNENNFKYANQTTASIIASNSGDGSRKKIDIKIDNGNIIFTSEDKELVLSNVNAKYMYLHTYMEVCNTKLYYINENNELYRIYLSFLVCQYDFDKEKLYIEKVTDSKVTDFLGYGFSYSRDNEMNIDITYHNVYYLLENGKVESLVINYYKHDNDSNVNN